MKSFVVRGAAATLAALILAGQSQAHEMFLRPARPQAAPNSQQTVRLVTGSFDKSENSVTRDRMADVSIMVSGRVNHPASSDWSDDDRKSYSVLRYGAGAPGTYVIGVSTRPNIISMSAKDFVNYLKHDGIVDTLAEFEKRGDMPTVRERYSKHVRTFVQVGDARTDDFSKPLGYPVEVLLDQNPFTLSKGSQLGFRVLLNGQPLANQVVRISHEGFHGHDAQGGHLNAMELRTDGDGRAKLTLSKASNWYISLIHMKWVGEPEVDYESNWATATFQVR